MVHRVVPHRGLLACAAGHWTPSHPCRTCEAMAGRVPPPRPIPAPFVPNPRASFWIHLITGIPVPNNKPHTEATKAKMRESHKEVGQRPEVKKARARGAALLWKDPEHREKVIAAQKAGWAARASRIKAQRDAKNAAAVAAHLARMGVNVRAA